MEMIKYHLHKSSIVMVSFCSKQHCGEVSKEINLVLRLKIDTPDNYIEMHAYTRIVSSISSVLAFRKLLLSWAGCNRTIARPVSPGGLGKCALSP